MLIYITQSTKQQIFKTEHHISAQKKLDDKIKYQVCNSKGNHNGLSGIIHFISCHKSGMKSIKHTATTELLRQYQMHEKLLLWLQIFAHYRFWEWYTRTRLVQLFYRALLRKLTSETLTFQMKLQLFESEKWPRCDFLNYV